MQRRSIVTRTVSAALLTLSACHDLPTAVTPTTPAPGTAVRSSAGGLHLGRSPLVCSLGRPAPAPATGWQTRRDTIFVPKSEYDERGRMVRYTLLQMAQGGAVAYTASCTVPYTEGALRRVDRHFGVEKGGGADQFVARQEIVTVQGCVSDGACAIEGLVVTAPPAPIKPHRTDAACLSDPAACEGTDDPGGDGWGGGDNTNPDDNSDPAETYEQGPLLWTACVLAVLSSSYTVSQVADKFDTWYKAYRDTEGAYNLWQATVQNDADVYTQQLYEDKYQQARRRQEDAKGAVSEATGATGWALAGAAVACGASALIPTP